MSRRKKKKSGDSRPAAEELDLQADQAELSGEELEAGELGEVLEAVEDESSDMDAQHAREADAALQDAVEMATVSELDLETADVDELRQALLIAQSEADEYLDGWQRARAEFANYKKRIERERQDSYERAAGETLLKVLGVLDDLERALRDRPRENAAGAWAEGIELIYRKFYGLLEGIGVEPIPAEGEAFDPMLHEALSHEESDEHEEGMVIDVLQRGYKLGDRVLRPAMVRVAK